MAPTARQVVDLAIEKLKLEPEPGKGYGGPLSRELGLSYQRVYRWLKPGNGPDAEGLLVVLERCGWLNIDEDVLVDVELPQDPLAELAKGVAALQDGQKEMLRLLRSRPAVRRSTPRAAAKRKSG